jgi:hypothetical protein
MYSVARRSLRDVRMIRKFYLALLLPVLLVLAQQGAVLHELSHYWAGSPDIGFQATGPGQDQKQNPTTPCEKCLVFAHFAGAISQDVVPLAQPLLAFDFTQRVAAAQRGADVPTARSRGPPSVL